MALDIGAEAENGRAHACPHSSDAKAMPQSGGNFWRGAMAEQQRPGLRGLDKVSLHR